MSKYTIDDLWWKWPKPGQILIVKNTDKSFINTDIQYIVIDVDDTNNESVTVLPRKANPTEQSNGLPIVLYPFQGDKFITYDTYPLDDSCLCNNCYVEITTDKGFTFVAFCNRYDHNKCKITCGEGTPTANILKIDYVNTIELPIPSDKYTIKPIFKNQYLIDKNKFLNTQVHCDTCKYYDEFEGTVIAWTYLYKNICFFVQVEGTTGKVIQVFPDDNKENITTKQDTNSEQETAKFDAYFDYNKFKDGKKSKYQYPICDKVFDFTFGEELEITGKSGEYVGRLHEWDVPTDKEIIRAYSNALFKTFMTMNNIEYNIDTQKNREYRKVYEMFEKLVEDECITHDELVADCEEYS